MVSYENAAKSILSIILNNGARGFEEAMMYLGSEHFTVFKYKVIWNGFQYLYENDLTINRVSLIKHLEVQKDSEGRSLLILISPNGKYEEWLSELKLFAVKDEIKDIYTYSKMMLDEFVVAKNNEMCSLVMAENTAGKQIKIIEEYAHYWYEADTKQYQTSSDILLEMADEAEHGILNQDRDIRNSVPFLADYLVLSPANTTVIAGDTGNGKTSITLQLIHDIARQQVTVVDQETGRPLLDSEFREIKRHRVVLLLSMEMEKHEVVGKMFCNRFNMSWEEMKALPDKKFAELATKMAKIMEIEMPNLVIESGEMSLADSRTHISNVDKKFGGIDVVVFDHIGLLSDVYEGHVGTENERYKYASRYIKMKIAVKMNTHCILLSQLNKAYADKTGHINHEPNSDRLYGSSGIKQDASNILFVYREYVNKQDVTTITIKDQPHQINTFFITRILVSKCRYGNVVRAKPVGFIPYLQRIVPLSKIKEFGLLNSMDDKFRLSEEQFNLIQ